ncbi:2563_t:CDS:1 [Ambispora leptoticha]|uniref:2563_t:CDS:1 n=1 Tax=Ambispora leptoticha TaxID=144679 RepID=A0A9N9B0M1_9GLOM|nr:2563_t:CDS:1 [Ambispora leptoticha]
MNFIIIDQTIFRPLIQYSNHWQMWKKLVKLSFLLTIIVLACKIALSYHERESFGRNLSGLSSNLLTLKDEYNLISTLQQRFTPNRKCKNLVDNNADNDEEKFITYLPHSGFHNQRIALENAIFIAWYTNRTLIVPPVILGKKIAWIKNPKLSNNLAKLNATKNLDECHSFPARSLRYERCIKGYNAYTLFPWDKLMDLGSIRNHISIINRQDFNPQDLYKLINITDPTEEVYYVKEKSRYDIQFYDQDGALNRKQNPKFERQLPLCSLLNRKEKLVHFRSIFSSNRIKTSLYDNQIFREMVKKKLVFNHPILTKVVKRITRKLGGSEKYIGLHLRVGDNGYLDSKAELIRSMIKAIKNEEGINQESDNFNETNNDNDGDDGIRKPTLSINYIEKCANTRSLFIATDGKVSDPVIQPIFTTFPCTFTIKDFSDEIQLLKQAKNNVDNSSLYAYFLPMVDLMVSAHGSKFFGTYGSTFSAYALRLHQVWIPDGTGKMISINQG